jgi:hypothetical protein
MTRDLICHFPSRLPMQHKLDRIHEINDSCDVNTSNRPLKL